MAMTRLMALLLHDVYQSDPAESGFGGAAAARYKLSLRELDAQLGRLAGVLGERPVMVTRAAPAPAPAMPVAITVDDGGVSYYTTLADRLEGRGWRGHCFVATGFVCRRGFLAGSQLRELHARGHVIGTHSVSHPARFAACTRDQMLGEWHDSRRLLEDILGEQVTVGSVPGGHYSRRVAEAADAAGLRVLFTSEPVTRVGRVGGCDVIGRFTLRAHSRPDLARDFATLRRGVLFREWAAWNGKKVLKALLGGGYPRFVEWAERISPQAAGHAH